MIRKLCLCYVAVLAMAAGSAQALTYVANLDGPSENPVNASPGVGHTQVDYDPVLHTLRVQTTFSGLAGTTSASHIHAPNATQLPGSDPPNPTFGVATQTPTFTGFPLGVTSGSMDQTLDLTQSSSWNPPYITNNGGTTAGAEAQLALTLSQGRAYLNIHTSAFPGGEIRGFLHLVPEPASLGLGVLSVVGLAAVARRKSKD
jgi:hypothetical protein